MVVAESQEFGALLRSHLAASGMTQADFAKKCGISAGQPNNYMAGRRVPKGARIERMIHVLGITGKDAEGFRMAAAVAHVPLALRHDRWLEKTVESRASAERRALFMAFACLRRWAPDQADALIAGWLDWPDTSPADATALLQASLARQEQQQLP